MWHASTSVADQGLLSAANLATGLVLAKLADPGTYGAYALAFAIYLVLEGVQGAVITSPLTILGAPREGHDLRRFTTALGLVQVAYALTASAACIAIALIVRYATAEIELPRVLIGLAAACFFMQLQTFFRRLLYSRLQPPKALLNDSLVCTVRLAGLAVLWLLDRGDAAADTTWLCGRNVFLSMALASFLGTLVGLVQARHYLLPKRPEGLRALLDEAWRMGRYGLGGQVGQAMFQLANRVAAAGVAGTVGVAMLEAPRLLVAPLHIISSSAGGLTAPRAARVHATGGRAALLRFAAPVAVLWGAAFLAYTAIIAAAPSFWLRAVYGSRYEGTEVILVLWCCTYAVAGMHVLPQITLRVTRNYDALMWTSLTAGVVVVTASFALTAWLGVVGAALGRLTGELALAAILAVMFIRRVLHHRIGGPPAASGPPEAPPSWPPTAAPPRS